jgi:membrane protease YdiL (CAAX protease family)
LKREAMRTSSPPTHLTASAVLVSAIVLCSFILWGGQQFAVLVLSGLSTEAPNAALDETIASAIIFGLLLVAGLVGGWLCGLNAAGLGPRPASSLGEGSAIGLGGLLVATALAAIAGVLHRHDGGSSAGLFLWGTALIVLQAGSEELFFRGWLQPVLVRSWGAWGILVTAIAFAALHLVAGASAGISLLNLFLGGLLFGLLAARSGGIAAAVAAHFAWNWAEQLVLGLDPNPGSGSFGSILNFDLIGSAWWGGSDEGLNASIAMTFALAILLTPLLILPARIPGLPGLYRSGRAPA